MKLENDTVGNEEALQSTKRTKFNELNISLGTVPYNTNVDRMENAANALNKALYVDVANFDERVPITKIDEATYNYEDVIRNFRGARNLNIAKRLEIVGFNDKHTDYLCPTYDFNHEHFYNTAAEASRGLHTVQTKVRDSYAKNKSIVAPGAKAGGREFAFERDDNYAKYPELKFGLGYDQADPHPQTLHAEHINDMIIDVVDQFPESFF